MRRICLLLFAILTVAFVGSAQQGPYKILKTAKVGTPSLFKMQPEPPDPAAAPALSECKT